MRVCDVAAGRIAACLMACCAGMFGGAASAQESDAAIPVTGSLVVSRVTATGIPEAEKVVALLDSAGISYEALDVCNWPTAVGERPQPDVKFRIAHTGAAILLDFSVREFGVRAETLEDGGKVYRDSCVEMFIKPEDGDSYYNFECNCIGTLLEECGRRSYPRTMASAETMFEVKRWTSLGRDIIAGGEEVTDYEVALVIPLSVFFMHSVASLDGRSMRANFYKCGPGPHYLSWSPVTTPRPQFHSPEHFGTLHFAEPQPTSVQSRRDK